jgi:hypothetical protein
VQVGRLNRFSREHRRRHGQQGQMEKESPLFNPTAVHTLKMKDWFDAGKDK